MSIPLTTSAWTGSWPARASSASVIPMREAIIVRTVSGREAVCCETTPRVTPSIMRWISSGTINWAPVARSNAA